MRIGEQPRLIFSISKFFWGCNRKSFEARIFLGASENENVCSSLLRSYGWKDFVGERTGI